MYVLCKKNTPSFSENIILKNYHRTVFLSSYFWRNFHSKFAYIFHNFFILYDAITFDSLINKQNVKIVF